MSDFSYRQFESYVRVLFLKLLCNQNLRELELTPPTLIYHTSSFIYMIS